MKTGERKALAARSAAFVGFKEALAAARAANAASDSDGALRHARRAMEIEAGLRQGADPRLTESINALAAMSRVIHAHAVQIDDDLGAGKSTAALAVIAQCVGELDAAHLGPLAKWQVEGLVANQFRALMPVVGPIGLWLGTNGIHAAELMAETMARLRGRRPISKDQR
jgi:hypothetical protein